MVSVLLTNHFMTQQVFTIHYSWFVDCHSGDYTYHTHRGVRVVLYPCICPSRPKMVWWTKSNLLGAKDGLVNKVKFVGSIVYSQCNQDQCNCGIVHSLLPLQQPIYSGIWSFCEWCGVKCFECCSGYKSMHYSPRCLTWLTRLLVFVKGLMSDITEAVKALPTIFTPID